jgi:hypothetical protein
MYTRAEMIHIWLIAIAGSCALAGLATAQTPAATSARVTGTVTAVNAQANQVSVKVANGDVIVVTTTARTQFLRVPPGETDAKKWPHITFSDIAVGDRVQAIGPAPAGQQELAARDILVMTKADVAEEHKEEAAEWQKRGTAGIVGSVDAAAKTFSIKSSQRPITVQITDKTEFRRYAADSVKFSDAKPSSLDELKAGDQVRVLGDKSADGSAWSAEQIVFGTFRQVAGTVKTLDAARGRITITDLATKKPLIVRISADSTARKIPAQMATMLAARYGRGGARGGDAGAAAGGGMRGGGGGMRGGGGGRGGGGDTSQMIERLPAMTIADLKPGDAIMLTGTVGSDPGSVTAIVVLAGVEPLLTASPTATRDIMAGWNLGGGGGGEE